MPTDLPQTPLADVRSATEADRVAARTTRRVRRYVAITVDAVLIVVFALIGRQAHGQALSLVGIAQTAWPFLVGGGMGWLIVATMLRRERLISQGVIIWFDAVVLGLLLRWATNGGIGWPFPLIAALCLGTLLVGWRFGWWLIGRHNR